MIGYQWLIYFLGGFASSKFFIPAAPIIETALKSDLLQSHFFIEEDDEINP